MTRYAARKLEQTAYHEAGHAVVACLMGIPFTSVTVAPGPVPVDEFRRTTMGQINFKFEWPEWAVPFHPDFDRKRTRKYVARNVCMTVARPLAETLRTRCWRQPPGQEGDDEFMAFEVALSCEVARTPKDTHRWVNHLRFSTLETLQLPHVWAAVDAVAQRLVKRKRLNSAEVHRLVSAALPCEADEQAKGPGTLIPGLHFGAGSAYRNRGVRPADAGANHPPQIVGRGRCSPISRPHGQGPAQSGQPGSVPPRACGRKSHV